MPLTQEELILKLERIELWPELKGDLPYQLTQAIRSKDKPLLFALLKAGTDPNPKQPSDCYLYHLLHEYQVEKTLNGTLILSLMELLLKHGANPNRIVTNNLRAYDYAKAWHMTPLIQLLEKYGADPQIREPV